jgi:hypothetical protein
LSIKGLLERGGKGFELREFGQHLPLPLLASDGLAGGLQKGHIHGYQPKGAVYLCNQGLKGGMAIGG